jgi:hypothetical protein
MLEVHHSIDYLINIADILFKRNDYTKEAVHCMHPV